MATQNSANLQPAEERLIRACEIANRDPDILGLEQDFEALEDRADAINDPPQVDRPQ